MNIYDNNINIAPLGSVINEDVMVQREEYPSPWDQCMSEGFIPTNSKFNHDGKV